MVLSISACHESCAETCSGSSPRDCEKCKEGWDMTEDEGCKGTCMNLIRCLMEIRSKNFQSPIYSCLTLGT